MNKNDEKICRLWDSGMHDLKFIARRLGYKKNATQTGIRKVKQVLLFYGKKV